MEKKILFVLLTLASIYGGFWLFNHINAWVGIILILIIAYVVIKILLTTFKNKTK